MLTVEDISNVEFTKTLGGYKTSEVDNFLDQCADTVSALNKEITALNKKLEVLADKVVEYREKLDAYQKEEDSIKTALVAAQRMGDNVVREAGKKSGTAAARRRDQSAEHKRDRLEADRGGN